MMQLIREKAQGVITWLVFIIIAITFLLWGVGGYFSGNNQAPIVAKVGKFNITQQEVDDIYHQWLRNNIDKAEFDALDFDSNKFKQKIIKSLAESRAFLEQTIADGFLISNNQVELNINNNPQFQKNGKFSLNKYKNILSNSAISEGYYEQALKQDLLRAQVIHGTVDSSFLLNDEINKIMSLWQQERNFGYTLIKAGSFKDNLQVDPIDVEQYYTDYKDTFVAPAKVKLAYIDLSIEKLMEQVNFTERDLIKYYDARKTDYATPELLNIQHILIAAPYGSDSEKSGEAREKINDILAKIKLGEDFAKMARTYSDDTISAKQDGNLGWISKGELDAALEQAVFSLQIGGISDVIKTPFGYHIVKLVDKKQAEQKSFELVREQVLMQYKREQAENVLDKKSEELANLAFEYPDSLQVASKALNLPIQYTEYFSKFSKDDSKNSNNNIITIKSVLKKAFDEDLIKLKHNSDLIRVNDERYIVIRVADYQEPYVQTLEQAKDKIIETLAQERAQLQAQELGISILKQLKNNASNTPYKVAKKHNLEWFSKTGINRTNTEINPYLLKQIFAMSKPIEQKNPVVSGFVMPNGDYAVVVLTGVNQPLEQSMQEDIRKVFKQQIALMKGRLEFKLYENALINKANIKYMQEPQE